MELPTMPGELVTPEGRVRVTVVAVDRDTVLAVSAGRGERDEEGGPWYRATRDLAGWELPDWPGHVTADPAAVEKSLRRWLDQLFPHRRKV
ncbi:hypothetical protein GCM10012275_54250 [Longimycelium tulufanense]|uniref:Uncharacterized protein n=1 Tax=Longimycelium tulufanense TaxID=907463 RepID=A0A8J3CJH7_9PSEU|nr:hypothetical protein [Longimycelium tulufanense]GGM76673.1 hypothetical protein GCM10012275_54250 [Longimycelium tulufanense]